MPLPRMRPSFVVTASCRSEDAMSILRNRLDNNPQGVEATFSHNHGVLSSRGENQRFWSPCLDLTIEDVSESSIFPLVERDDVKTKVWGTFSPRAEIWTGFVFAIGTLMVVSLLAIIFGLAQVMLGETPWALLIPVVALLIAVGIYASALVGQGLSGDEIYRIRSYVDACLHEADEAARRQPPLRPDASSQL
jgi:hypothetical protein